MTHPTRTAGLPLLAGLALLLAGAAGAQEPPPPTTREVDTTGPEALALDDLLQVPPQYCAKDGTVVLEYQFLSEAELQDFTIEGKCDRVEARGDLEIGVGSQAQGIVLHRLELRESFEISLDCRIEWMSGRSDLVFMFGRGGARWGNQLVQRGGSGFRPVGRGEPARDRFNGARRVSLRWVCRDGELTAFVNDVNMGSTDRLEGRLAGRFGIYLTDMRLVVTRITINGAIDPSKL